MVLKVKILSPTACAPKKAYCSDAGYDVSSNQELVIEPGQRAAVSTGIAVQCNVGYYTRVAPRSGMAARSGIDVLAGVIDSSYEGEIKVILVNHGQEPFKISLGDRIAQLIVTKIQESDQVLVVDSFEKSDRGSGGFGSTGQ